MGGDVNKLVINTNDEREQWASLLKAASEYHYDISGEVEPDPEVDPDDENDMKIVAQIHRAWGRAIADAVHLIAMWEMEEEIVTVDSTPPTKNVTPTDEEE